MDKTENFRRAMVGAINSEVASDSPDAERLRLEKEYGQVWDTNEVGKVFEIIGFFAPYVKARRLSDNVEGILMFQHHPRFYFNFR